VLQHGGIFQPQLVRAQQQFGEVHQAGATTGFLIGRVDVDESARYRVVAMLDAVRPLALVLPLVDLPAGLARRELRLVQPQPGHHALDQPLLVVGIQDLERLGEAASRQCRRSRRWAMPWKVPTVSPWVPPGISEASRARISPAALLVKVTARIAHGGTPSACISQPMRWVSTRVLPEPAPASTR